MYSVSVLAVRSPSTEVSEIYSLSETGPSRLRVLGPSIGQVLILEPVYFFTHSLTADNVATFLLGCHAPVLTDIRESSRSLSWLAKST